MARTSGNNSPLTVNDLAAGIIAGERTALARAITLAESTRHDDRERAEVLLTRLLPHTGGAMRIGISGAPGVGKSTFIEAFGLHLVAQDRKIAVLAVDPSSRRSGGSILGDKTRMEKLARDSRAFIRPSPAGTTLGGVARRTRECLLLAESAGFDVVLIETVGVGQSEIAVAEMTDLFVLLAGPGGGDELQGIKRGVMELADLVLVTKADGDLLPAARRAVADYHAALHLLRPRHKGLQPAVLGISALEGKGIAEAWEAMCEIHKTLAQSGRLTELREAQRGRWFQSEIQEAFVELLRADSGVARCVRELETDVRKGLVLPTLAARDLIRIYWSAQPQ